LEKTMTARSFVFASILVGSTPVSSDEMSHPAVVEPTKSSKTVLSLPLAIGFEDRQGDFSGVALIAQ
jgi:hypothetical protein